MRWVEKLIAPFMMGRTSSTIMQTLGQIDQRAPVIGVKIWHLYIFFLTCRIAAKKETACMKFTQRPKINHHFRPTGAICCTDSCEIQASHEIDVRAKRTFVPVGMADGYEGALGRSKFYIDRCTQPHGKVENFHILPARRVAQHGPCYGNVAGWLSQAAIVSKRV